MISLFAMLEGGDQGEKGEERGKGYLGREKKNKTKHKIMGPILVNEKGWRSGA